MMLRMCEGFKLAYADYLLRQGLLGQRTALLQFDFDDSVGVDKESSSGSRKRGGDFDSAGLGE
jgi:hypothetical protein